MRKLIASLLTILMFLVTIPPVSVLAESDDEQGDYLLDKLNAVNKSIDLVPDDRFEGDYTELENKDGTKSYVFENGSVITEYEDGTREGFDYKGNHHYYDKDDNTTVMIKDGTVWTEYADGRNSITLPGGNDTVVIDSDRCSCIMSKRTGTVKEYDSNGHCTGLGFIGSDERLKTDEYGDLKDGMISGPNGAFLEIKDGGAEKHFVSPYGAKFDYKETGFADSFEGRTESYVITDPDGTKKVWDKITKINRDKSSGVSTGKTVETSGGVYLSDGEKIEFEEKMLYDKNGDPYYSANNVAQWTGADGKTLWIDKNVGAFEYNDPNTGDKVITDANGNLTEYKLGKNELKVDYNSDGSIKTAHCKTENGAELTLANGSGQAVLPNGDVFEVDSEGTITKNGKVVKKDGEWVEGYDPSQDFVTTEENKKEDTEHGVWKLIEAQTEGDRVAYDGWGNAYEHVYKVSPGEFEHTWTCSTDYYAASGTFLNRKGDTSTVTCINSAPPEIIKGGETVSLSVTLNGHYEKRQEDVWKDPADYQDGGNMDICTIYSSGGYAYFSFGESGDTLYTSWDEPSASRTFTCEIKKGFRDGVEMDIRVCSLGMTCHYRYQWVE
ncbi:MAG: hypothetical protein E7295_02245 [Lachnospiraceae bacterium]|jgi:hypothetical protein|nr:hypothetical protein [Lachnospiraceae bacterium]